MLSARFAIVFTMLAGHALVAKPTRFEVKDPFSRNVVRAESEAPLERTTALLNFLQGWIEIDPQDLTQGITAELEVDLRRVETGVPSKDDFIREKLIATPEFPIAKVRVDGFAMKPAKKALTDQPLQAKVNSKIQFRGQIKDIQPWIKLTYHKQSDFTKQRLPGNLLRLSSQGEVDFPSFGVPFSDKFAARFTKAWQLLIDVIGSDQVALEAGLTNAVAQ